jgi:hypothetical protein
MSSSCLIPADNVGWLTLQASAALPKCCSRASAITNSSLSIMMSTQRPRVEHATRARESPHDDLTQSIEFT